MAFRSWMGPKILPIPKWGFRCLFAEKPKEKRLVLVSEKSSDPLRVGLLEKNERWMEQSGSPWIASGPAASKQLNMGFLQRDPISRLRKVFLPQQKVFS